MADTPVVQSLARGLNVIHSFNGERPRQTLAQVAEVTGLARATARRFLHTLVAEGYARTDGSDFWLTPRVLELGYSYLSSLGLPDISQPHLRELSTKLDESCSVSVLDRDTVVFDFHRLGFTDALKEMENSELVAEALGEEEKGLSAHLIAGPASVMRLPLLFKGDDFVHTDIVPAYSPAP